MISWVPTPGCAQFLGETGFLLGILLAKKGGKRTIYSTYIYSVCIYIYTHM